MSGKSAASSTHLLVVPSATRYLKKVRRFIRGHGRKADYPEEVISEICTAVDEACANIIEHAYKGQPDKEVRIEVAIKPTCCEVSLSDEGDTFDRSAYREPDVVLLTQRRASGGLGVRMIRSLMDLVEYKTRGSTNEIKLTKYCSPQSDR